LINIDRGVMMEENKTYNVIDLFAGCGGLSNGFEQAGFKIIAANEFWKPAQETYIKNHPNTKFFPGDITDPKTKNNIFEFFKDKECDVLTGGPPCQAYSMAGRRDPNDPRGKLFEDYVEIVEKLNPKVFVMENVKGILTMRHERDDLNEDEKEEAKQISALEKERGDLLLLRKQSKNNPEKFKWTKENAERIEIVKKTLINIKNEKSHLTELVTDKIIKRFKTLGYNVIFKLLNSADFGVPQKRQRVIFIGTKFDIPIIHPEPTHSEKGKIQMGKTSFMDDNLKPWLTVREAIDDLKDKPNNEKISHILTSHNEEFTNKIKNTSIGKSVFGGYSDAFFRNRPDEPSRTVKENHGGVLVHYEKNRCMTPRELARLQSFPDDYLFESSKSMILKQIGNAVPPGLGKAIGKSVKNILDEIERINSKDQMQL
jgi:DNA (cytosine-5)-methyltransferase 1